MSKLKTYVVTEVCTYEVEATSEEEAEQVFLKHALVYETVIGPVKFTGVEDRTVEAS